MAHHIAPHAFVPNADARPSGRRRLALSVLVAAASVLSATGCGSTSNASEPTPAPTPTVSVPVTTESTVARPTTTTGTALIEDQPGLQSALDDLIGLGVPGAVLLVADGDRSTVLTSGVSDLETGTPMAADASFRIASMTKPYTAAVVMQLVGEGVLHLDDTVGQWLPGIVQDADLITIRELLHHTSGIADYFDDPSVIEPYLEGDFEHVWTPGDLIGVADRLGATSAPGTEWRYSNTNYAIVALIVEQATGHSFGDEMQTRIFGPLDLQHTTFPTDTHLDATIAHGYLIDGDEPVDVTGVYPFPFGAGNIISDAADAATFSAALFGGELVAPELLEQMMPLVGDDAVPYGLGVMPWELPCGVAYGHDGGFAGYSTRSLVLDSGRQVVILANSITLDDHVAADAAADDLYDAIIETAMCG